MHRTAISGPSTASRALRSGLLGGILAVALAGGLVAQTTESFELRAGVVVDRQAEIAYVMSPAGGIDAVSLATGGIAWHSDAAARPISVSAAGLLAQVESAKAGSLELAVLDAAGRLVKSTTVALPAGVEARVADSLSERFLVRGAATGPGQAVQVHWQSTVRPARGALIADETTAPRVESGAFAFDPVSGVPGASMPGAAFPAPQIQVAPAQRLPVTGNQYLSADGGHRLASVLASGAAVETYQWTLFDANGSRLGSFSNRAAYAPFYVGTSGFVVYVSQPGAWLQGDKLVPEPLSLRAVSFANGSEQWRHPIRDTEYRGPFPP